MTLYSLSPTDAPNLREYEADRADELDFLRGQILPGCFFACDFMPRHGFRLSTAVAISTS